MFMKKFINFLFCKFLFRVHYYNIENLEIYDKYLICPNHSCVFDPFFIYPKTKNLSIMAKSEIFKNKLIAKILTHYNVFPVNRNKVDVKSLFHSLSIFKEDIPCEFLIFVEGGVVKNKEDIGTKVHNGAVFVASKLHVPIIPVYITRRPKFFSKVDVIFGKPYFLDKSILKNKSLVKEESRNLINKIYGLKKESK